MIFIWKIDDVNIRKQMFSFDETTNVFKITESDFDLCRKDMETIIFDSHIVLRNLTNVSGRNVIIATWPNMLVRN